MRVLIIGASGAVGTHLTRQLTEQGQEVTGTCRSASKKARIRSAGAAPLVLDVLDAAATTSAVAHVRPDAIIYQATALAGIHFGRSLDKTFAPTNRLRTDGTDNVIAAARSAAAPKLVAQSFAPYRYASSGLVASEDDPVMAEPPASAAQTFAAQTFAAMTHLDQAVTTAGGIALRYGGFYGEPDQMTTAVAKRRYPLIGDGRGMMSFIHLHDAAAATVLALQADGPGWLIKRGPAVMLAAIGEAEMADWDDFVAHLLDALRRFVEGDAEPYKRLWSRRDDVTIFGGWGGYEQGWANVGPRLDWAASRYSEGWLDQENLGQGTDRNSAYSVDIERSGGRFDDSPDVREASLRVTHIFRREDATWMIVHRHADFLQPRQEPR